MLAYEHPCESKCYKSLPVEKEKEREREENQKKGNTVRNYFKQIIKQLIITSNIV